MAVKELVAGGVITLVIGGTAYSVNQADVVDNFAQDTGVTQQQAEEYVNGIKESDLESYSKIGDTTVSTGNEILNSANSIDCTNYQYEWESATLSCPLGKTQLVKFGNDAIRLGNAYKVLGSDSASDADISTTITLIGIVNSDYDLEVVKKNLTPSEIDESKKANSYNKATLQAALKSSE